MTGDPAACITALTQISIALGKLVEAPLPAGDGWGSGQGQAQEGKGVKIAPSLFPLSQYSK